MQRVHIIAIGGAAMLNLAVALSKKNNYILTGSDEFISEQAALMLKARKLMPDKKGWFPDKISKNISAVIMGPDTQTDNPELIRAKELGLKIYSIPEYLFVQTRNKTRIVVSGCQGKTNITAMILHVLKKLKMEADYVINHAFNDFENLVHLSYDARIAVFEGDDTNLSMLTAQPDIHQYKPHIAVLTGFDIKCRENKSGFKTLTEQTRQFIELMEIQGRLIYFEPDETLGMLTEKLRRDIVPFPYNCADYEIVDHQTFLKTKKGPVGVKISGDANMQDLQAARLACRQIGITEEQFNRSVSDFELLIHG